MRMADGGPTLTAYLILCLCSSGASGFITLGTGEASGGHGGDIWIRVGTGQADDGGDVIISGQWPTRLLI